MHTLMSNINIIIVRVFQKHLSDQKCAHWLIDHRTYRKLSSRHKWTDCEYHVQDKKYLQHKSVNMSCASMQLNALLFCGPHAKPHGVRGSSKHYILRLEPKWGDGKCAIRRIACAYKACTNMLDKTWVIGSDLIRKPRYQPV